MLSLLSQIYNCTYWKESCFGLTAEALVERAVALKYCGGTYGGNNKPTAFLCLVLKLLQLQPDKDIVVEFIRNEEFKYLRMLGAFYFRLTGKAEEVYEHLEPLYNDYRKIAYRSAGSWAVKHIDEFVDELLTEELVCDIALPHLPKRSKLEELGTLPLRVSALDYEMELQQLEDEEQQLKVDDDGLRVGEEAAGQEGLRYSSSGDDVASGPRERSRSRSPPNGRGGDRDRDRREDSRDGRNVLWHAEDAPLAKPKKSAAEKFDAIFNKKKAAAAVTISSSSAPSDANTEEGSVEYWNQKRIALGLKPLNSKG